MAGEWRLATIEEVAEKVAMGPFGSSIKVETFVPSGVPVISGQHLHGSRLDDTQGFNFVSPEHAERLKNANVKRGDIVLTHRGNIGQVSYIPGNSEYERYIISQSQFYMRCDVSAVIPEFVVAYFKASHGQHKLLANASQVGVPSIAQPVTYLRTIEIPVPPLSEQRAIAHILGTLDDKIELNRRMSETLEAMARALYKSWFVDFDPVRAKMEGRWRKGESLPGLPAHLYGLFPNRLVDSELGEIPEGWQVGTFADIVELLRDQVNPLEMPSAHFRHFSIPAFDEGQWPKDELGETIKSQKSRVLPGVVLLSKLNPEIERVWLVDIEPDSHAVCSTEFLVLRPRKPAGRAFMYGLARSVSFRKTLEGLVTGTSKSHQRVQAASLLALSGIRPSAQITQAFEQRVEPLLARSLKCRREGCTLASLRDTFLPKLVSGELRLKGADKFLEGSEA